MPAKTESPDEYLTSRDVMDRLRISRRTLDRWVAKGILPATRIPGSGVRRYQGCHVDKLLRGESAQ